MLDVLLEGLAARVSGILAAAGLLMTAGLLTTGELMLIFTKKNKN